MNSRQLKIILVPVVLFMSKPLCAHQPVWSALEQGKGVATFVDSTSIKYADGVTTAWILSNYDEPQTSNDLNGKSYKSLIVLTSFDCKKERYAQLQVEYYSEQSGAGDNVWTYIVPDNNGTYSYVIPGTIGSAELDSICAASPPHRK